MTRRHWLISLRAILIGWATLLLFALLLAHPLFNWAVPIVGGEWMATVKLDLDCTVLAAAGWVVGRLSRPISMLGVLVFAATLTVQDFSSLVEINVPGLLRLAARTLSGDAQVSSLISAATNEIILFVCLVAGGLVSRPGPKPASISGQS